MLVATASASINPRRWKWEGTQSTNPGTTTEHLSPRRSTISIIAGHGGCVACGEMLSMRPVPASTTTTQSRRTRSCVSSRVGASMNVPTIASFCSAAGLVSLPGRAWEWE